MNKIYIVMHKYDSYKYEPSIRGIFSTKELAEQYIKDIDTYDGVDCDEGYYVDEHDLDIKFETHLHECINCKKQTLISKEECCEDSDLRWIEDAQSHYKWIEDAAKIGKHVENFYRINMDVNQTVLLIYEDFKEHNRNQDLSAILDIIKSLLNDENQNSDYSEFMDKMTDRVTDMIVKKIKEENAKKYDVWGNKKEKDEE